LAEVCALLSAVLFLC